jgi:hypothetical protein
MKMAKKPTETTIDHEAGTVDKQLDPNAFPGDTAAPQSDTIGQDMTEHHSSAAAVNGNEPESYNPFLDFEGEQISERYIVGTLLKFNKGDFLAGQENMEIKVDTQMVCNMNNLLIGWIRWEDQKPVEHRMGLVVDGFKPAKRDTLGYGYKPGDMAKYPPNVALADDDDEAIDRSDWPVDETSKQPRDPWVFSNYLVMKDPTIADVDEGIYTFATSSTGGRNTVFDVRKWYGQKMSQHPDDFPVVLLKVGSYMHSNKSFGRIKIPVLKPIGWCAKAVFGQDVQIDVAKPQQIGGPKGEPKSEGEKIPF